MSASLALLERAHDVIPAATQTLSKGFTQFPLGVSPVFCDRADGCYLWDVDGNRFIDYGMGLGPVLLGHNHASVRAAVVTQLESGHCFTLPHAAEVDLAVQLRKMIPNAEMSRFGKNGSDATSAAVRVARAFTGRDIVATCGYHGWHDWYAGTTARSAGVPDGIRRDVRSFTYNDLASLEQIFNAHDGDVACVIIEPVGVEEPERGFLEGVARLTKRHGALLVFDECWTGFRLARGGAQEYFGVECDLCCFGKGLGNGFAISAITGRREVMTTFERVFFSLTFGGDMIGIRAALAVLQVLDAEPVVEHIRNVGQMLRDETTALVAKHGLSRHVVATGLPARHAFYFLREDGSEWLALKSLMIQEALRRGILFPGYHVVSYAHTVAIVEQTLEEYNIVLGLVADAVASGTVGERLEGEVVKPVFRRL